MMKHLRITVDGKAYDVVVEDLGEDTNGHARQVSAPRPVAAAVAAPVAAAPRPVAPPSAAPASSGPGDQLAPLAGVILELNVNVGDTVEADQQVAILEAMKMKTVIGAHKAGQVTAVFVKAGDSIDADQPLLTIA